MSATMVAADVDVTPNAAPCNRRTMNRSPIPVAPKYATDMMTLASTPIMSIRLEPIRAIHRPTTIRAIRAPRMKMLAAKPAWLVDEWNRPIAYWETMIINR
jgi:hypothetical protein